MDLAIFSKYRLPSSYFHQTDVVELARDLIGKIIFSNINGEITASIITETEAYAGIDDKASHAYGNRRTRRTETMYLDGGHAYVYLIYGIHHLFNVVTNKKEIPHAVLIRGAYPVLGKDLMASRNNEKKPHWLSLTGPGKFSKLMGITTALDAIKLEPKEENSIWLEDWDLTKDVSRYVLISKRIGIDYAEEDADLPYRFYLPSKSDKILSLLEKVRKPIDH